MFLLIAIVRRLVILALVLAVPIVAGELIARKLIGDAVSSAVRQRIGVGAHVSLGASPVLLQLVHGRIDTATVSATRASIGGLPPVALTATLHDVHLTNVTSLQGAIGSLTVAVRLTPGEVRDLLATPGCIESLPADVRTALTPTPRVLLFPGRVDLLPPAGRAVEVRLRPAAAHARVVFHLRAIERGGAEASAPTLAAARAQTNCSRSLPSLPFGISLVSATARGGALALAFAGTDARFSALG
jgi:LmeA-like phospholipid-binding